MDKNIEDIYKSFNKMKNTLYPTSYEIKKYEYVDIANILAKEEKTQEDWEIIEKFHHYISTIKDIIEDIGNQIMAIREINFENKHEVEVFSKEIIELVDKFIDTLAAINNNFRFSNDDVNTRMSEFHLKSLRSKFIKAVNSYKIKFDVNIEKDEIRKIYTFVNDILDDIIREAVSLRVDRLYDVLEKQMQSKNQ
jgi:hypothetical protein